MRRSMPPPCSRAQHIDQHSGDRRRDEDKHAENYSNSDHRPPGSHCNDIIAARDEKHGQKNKKTTSNSGVDGLLIRKAQYVVVFLVKAHELFHKGVSVKRCKDQGRQQYSGKKDFRNQVRPKAQIDARKQPHRSFDPTEVPIRLSAGCAGYRIIRSINPDRVYLRQSPQHRYQSKNKKK